LRLDSKMRWFRDNIGQGTWLALLALVINLGLSFGHVHAIAGERSEHVVSVAAHHGKTQGQTNGGHPSGQADDLCPICTAAAAMASPLASPPVLRVEFAGVTIDRGIEPVVVVADPPRAAFQSRGPPIS
jgi:hypothetical protein